MRLIDFGLAKKIGVPSQADAPVSPVTHVQESFGNAFLELPEFARGSKYRTDPRSDLTLTLGVLYFLITGEKGLSLGSAVKPAPNAEQFREQLALWLLFGSWLQDSAQRSLPIFG